METNDLLKKAKESLMYITDRPDIIFVRGEGNYLFDSEGKKYLDFISGWAVCCLGHTSKVITKALIEQANKLINPSPSFYNQPMIEFADYLTKNSCMNKVFFANTGAEANEGAVKLARKYGQLHKQGAYEIITTWNAFHGRTLAMMAASGKINFDKLYLPKPEGFTRVPLNDLDALKKQISSKTIAIMLEPIQGEGGVNPANKEYLQAVRKLCDENQILLIYDEVQTGIGRLGTLFGYQYYGIEPDILTLAKGIGGGYPLAALLAKDKFVCFEAGDQGGTYCGAPLATAVGLAVVKEIVEKNIPARVKKVGRHLEKRLKDLMEKRPDLFVEVRGAGLLIALGLKVNKAKEIVAACLQEGLILNAPNETTIRFMPALIVTEDDVDEMIGSLTTIVNRL
jgi:acetylornithine/N-succinyldiaminopimelate aminotransferase